MPLIKRYANRKLYDTQAGQYVTLEELADFIRRGEDVTVLDHATGRDLTSLTLMQILINEEKKLGELLPQVVLTRLIRTGGETLESLRARMLAAFDPNGLVEEEIHRRVEQLVLSGELAASEAGRFLDKLIDPAHRWDVQHRTTADPQAGSSELPGQLQALHHQVEMLEEQLAQLRNSAEKKTGA